MVAIITTGNPTPLRMKNVIWNLAEDKITATDVSGGAPRSRSCGSPLHERFRIEYTLHRAAWWLLALRGRRTR